MKSLPRNDALHRLEDKEPWDVLIIGGGATGLGAALDAAARGYKTLLLERYDFAKGTSSRSTKLIHGGVRYLKQGNISLVRDALLERGRLMRNAPHLVHALQFIIPAYAWTDIPFYGLGLKAYDALAGQLSLGSSHILSKQATEQALPCIKKNGLHGGIAYFDAQFDDARLAITLAKSAQNEGATILNYINVSGFIKKGSKIKGVIAVDKETGKEYSIQSRSVINASGVFMDSLRILDDPQCSKVITPSRGIHLVLDRRCMPSRHAMMVPKTKDGRVIFAIPWQDRVILGTTDTPTNSVNYEPKPSSEEISFLLEHAKLYFNAAPDSEAIMSLYAGLRPLVQNPSKSKTASLSRDHQIIIEPSGMITIAGGKWTTYRKMGEDVIDVAMKTFDLPRKPSLTHNLKLDGAGEIDPNRRLAHYGTHASTMESMIKENKPLGEKLHERLPYTKAEVLWAIEHEMARSVEDVLARRTRALILDAKAAKEAAPVTAELMAQVLGKDKSWIDTECEQFNNTARSYVF